ncbi:MAG: hypothetical protein ACI9FD_001377 [Gammaproteobacteria bacterium]
MPNIYRWFEQCITIKLSGPSGGGALQLSHIELQFKSGGTDIVVADGRTPVAVAMVSTQGSGRLQARWEVARPTFTLGEPIFSLWRPVTQVVSCATKRRFEVELPSGISGTYLVRMRLVEPAADHSPVIRYHIGSTSVGKPKLELLAPANDALVTPETEFSWRNRQKSGAPQQLVVFDTDIEGDGCTSEQDQKPRTGVYVAPDVFKTALSPAGRKRLDSGEGYCWQIRSKDNTGKPIGSEQRLLHWIDEPDPEQAPLVPVPSPELEPEKEEPKQPEPKQFITTTGLVWQGAGRFDDAQQPRKITTRQLVWHGSSNMLEKDEPTPLVKDFQTRETFEVKDGIDTHSGVVGRLLDSLTGGPLRASSARNEYSVIAGQLWTGGERTMADAATSRYQLELAAGSHGIRTQANNYAGTTEQVEVLAFQLLAKDFYLEPNNATIYGSINLRASPGLDGLIGRDASIVVAAGHRRILISTADVTQSFAFRIENIVPPIAPVRLTVSLAGFRPTQVDVHLGPGEERHIIVDLFKQPDPGFDLSGIVYDATSRQPLANVAVLVSSLPMAPRVCTDSAGRYTIRGLGTTIGHFVDFGHPDYSAARGLTITLPDPLRRSLFVNLTATPDAFSHDVYLSAAANGSELSAELNCLTNPANAADAQDLSTRHSGWWLHGRVIDQKTGRGVANAAVEFAGKRACTDSRGGYRISPLNAGSGGMLFVALNGYDPKSKWVGVSNPAAEDIHARTGDVDNYNRHDFQIAQNPQSSIYPSGCTPRDTSRAILSSTTQQGVRGTVFDRNNGLPLANTWIEVGGAYPVAASTCTNGQGVFIINDVPLVRYYPLPVQISRPGYSTQDVEIGSHGDQQNFNYLFHLIPDAGTQGPDQCAQ